MIQTLRLKIMKVSLVCSWGVNKKKTLWYDCLSEQTNKIMIN